MQAIIGRKIGMTRIFSDTNESIPVTVISVPSCEVVDIKTKKKHGYAALCIGMEKAKPIHVNKPMQGFFKKAGVQPLRIIKEVPVKDGAEYKVGQVVGVEIMEGVKKVHVTGRTKGHGFSGTIKRYHFHLGPGSHGNKNHRKPGAIGACAYPGRTMPGKKMYGHDGDKNRMVRNLEVVKVDKENGILLVRGAIPGGTRGLVHIRKA